MTQFSVGDDSLGKFYRRMNVLAERMGKSLSYHQTMDALQMLLEGKVVITLPPLLELVKEVELPRSDTFMCLERFRDDGAAPDGVNIKYVDDRFRELYKNKKAPGLGEHIVYVRTGRESTFEAIGQPIMRELMHRSQGNPLLPHSSLWELLKAQPQGEEGPLLVNGRFNIAIIGLDEVILVVWSSGWNLVSVPIDSTYWKSDVRIISR